MDKIFIHQLKVSAIIGVLPHEQNSPQDILIDLEVSTDIQQAVQQDDIKLTIDYTSLREAILIHIKNTHYQLVETLAENLAQLILQTFNSDWLRLQITKMPADITDAKGVGVIIERSANSYSV